jgi:hypothetical protein
MNAADEEVEQFWRSTQPRLLRSIAIDPTPRTDDEKEKHR